MEAPTNGELALLIQGQGRELVEKIDSGNQTSARVEVQAIKTNGRVTQLENRMTEQEKWRAYITGGFAVVVLILIPIVIALILRKI